MNPRDQKTDNNQNQSEQVHALREEIARLNDRLLELSEQHAHQPQQPFWQRKEVRHICQRIDALTYKLMQMDAFHIK